MHESLKIGERGWTNNVLFEHQKERDVYYLPCYLRLKIKKFMSINIFSQEAEINADLLFTVYYGLIPAFIIQ
jgi:hypothetical protein